MAGDFREAQKAWEEAISIRNYLQETGTGKQLFCQELDMAQKALAAIADQRATARSRWKRKHGLLRAVAAAAATAAPAGQGLSEVRQASIGADGVERLLFSRCSVVLELEEEEQEAAEEQHDGSSSSSPEALAAGALSGEAPAEREVRPMSIN